MSEFEATFQSKSENSTDNHATSPPILNLGFPNTLERDSTLSYIRNAAEDSSKHRPLILGAISMEF